MSIIKTGPQPNGAYCLDSEDIGLFNVRVIQEPNNTGYAVIYSYDQTRLECLEYEPGRDGEIMAMSAYNMIRQTIKNARACLISKLAEVLTAAL